LNHIGDEGAQYLAHALQTNAVRLVPPCQSHTISYVLIQTLTTLDLDRNEIGAEGLQHLANALQSNTVRELTVVGNNVSAEMVQHLMNVGYDLSGRVYFQ
jgi:hypothetical protein